MKYKLSKERKKIRIINIYQNNFASHIKILKLKRFKGGK